MNERVIELWDRLPDTAGKTYPMNALNIIEEHVFQKPLGGFRCVGWHLGVAGLGTNPLRATVAELWLTPCENTCRNRTSQNGALRPKSKFLQ